MGNNQSFLFQRSLISFPKKVKLHHTDSKKYNNRMYLYFTPAKQIKDKFIKIQFKKLEKPIQTFCIFINRGLMKHIVIDNKDYYEYKHSLSSGNEILVRTDIYYRIQSIVYIISV